MVYVAAQGGDIVLLGILVCFILAWFFPKVFCVTHSVKYVMVSES